MQVASMSTSPSVSISTAVEPKRRSLSFGQPQGAPAPTQESVTATPTTPRVSQPPIPRIVNVAPAIFVPLEEDITKPMDEPRDRIERAKRVLQSVEFHKRAVRANFFRLVDNERRLIVQSVRDYEEQHGPQPQQGIGAEEADEVIRCMSAPVDPDTDYNISTEGFGKVLGELFQGTDETPTRSNALRQLQRNVEQGLMCINGYTLHIDGIQQRWQATVEKEERVLEGFGLHMSP